MRSINTKYDFIKQLITQEQLDILSCQETWQCLRNDPSLQAATPIGYEFVDAVRADQPGYGGVCIFFKSIFQSRQLELPTLSSFEAVAVQLCDTRTCVIVINIYRPPSEDVEDFLTEFNQLLCDLSRTFLCPVIIAGDINIHLEKPNKLTPARLIKLLYIHRLYQNIKLCTHFRGGILDVVITDEKGIVTDIKLQEVPHQDVSDHDVIMFSYKVQVKRKKQVRS